MTVPSHGYNCQTIHSYLTVCKHCHSKVVYFECSCGSKVFLENGIVHDCKGKLKFQSNPFNKLRDEDLRLQNSERLLLIKKTLLGINKSSESADNPHWTEYNGCITRRLVIAVTKYHKGKKTLSELSFLWADYLHSLETFNLCGNCEKPIKTQMNDTSSCDSRNLYFGEITAHFQMVDRYNGESISKPTLKTLRYSFIKNYRVYNSKCDCLFKRARHLGIVAEKYISSTNLKLTTQIAQNVKEKLIICELCNSKIHSDKMAEHLRDVHTRTINEI